MNMAPPKPQAPPSHEHKWGLMQISKNTSWVGLSEREFVMLYENVVINNTEDWLMWFLGWPAWKKVSEVEKFWRYQFPPADADLPQPVVPRVVPRVAPQGGKG